MKIILQKLESISLIAAFFSCALALFGFFGIDFIKLEICSAALFVFVSFVILSRLRPLRQKVIGFKTPEATQNNYPWEKAFLLCLGVFFIMVGLYFALASLQYGTYNLSFESKSVSQKATEPFDINLCIQEKKISLYPNTYQITLEVPSSFHIAYPQLSNAVVYGSGKQHESLTNNWLLTPSKVGEFEIIAHITRTAGNKHQLVKVRVSVDPPLPLFEVRNYFYPTYTNNTAGAKHFFQVQVQANKPMFIISAKSRILAIHDPNNLGAQGLGSVMSNVEIDNEVRSFGESSSPLPIISAHVETRPWIPQSVEEQDYHTMEFSFNTKRLVALVDFGFAAHPKGHPRQIVNWKSPMCLLRTFGPPEFIDINQWSNEMDSLPESAESLLHQPPYSFMFHGVESEAAFQHPFKIILVWAALLKEGDLTSNEKVHKLYSRLASIPAGKIEDEQSEYQQWVSRMRSTYENSLINFAESTEIPIVSRRALLPYVDEKTKMKLAGSVKASEILSDLANSTNVYLRVRVAQNADASDEVLERLAQDREPTVREAVASNLSTPSNVLNALSIDSAADVRRLADRNRQMRK